MPILIALLLLIFPLPTLAQGPNAAIAALKFAPDQVGYVLIDDQGRAILAHNADKAFIPASVTKIPTTIAALAQLGPDHRFVTRLVARLTVLSSVATGDLWLVGGGDPLLSSDQLATFVQALRSAGIARVNGRLYFDSSALPTLGQIDNSQAEAASYNPGVGALSLNFNRVGVSWQTAKNGTLSFALASRADRGNVQVEWIPVSRRTDAAPSAEFLRDPAGRDRWRVNGELENKGFLWLPVAEPGRNAAYAFRELARKSGIIIAEPIAGRAPPDARELAKIESLPLSAIAQLSLRYSNNLTAELLGLAATRAMGAQPADLAQSAAAEVAWFKKRLPDIDWRGFDPRNHSGLTPQGRATPWQLAQLVRAARDPALTGSDYFGLLKSYAGEDDDSGLEAKTGTLDFASALAGVIRRRAGEPAVYFAIMVADFERRAALDGLSQQRSLASPPGAVEFRKRARRLIQTLTRDWQAGEN